MLAYCQGFLPCLFLPFQPFQNVICMLSQTFGQKGSLWTVGTFFWLMTLLTNLYAMHISSPLNVIWWMTMLYISFYSQKFLQFDCKTHSDAKIACFLKNTHFKVIIFLLFKVYQESFLKNWSHTCNMWCPGARNFVDPVCHNVRIPLELFLCLNLKSNHFYLVLCKHHVKQGIRLLLSLSWFLLFS